MKLVKLIGADCCGDSIFLKLSLGTAESGRSLLLEPMREPKLVMAEGGLIREMLLDILKGGSLPMILRTSSSLNP